MAPIFANALAHFDIPVSYIGCLGSPELHPVFDEFARNVKDLFYSRAWLLGRD